MVGNVQVQRAIETPSPLPSRAQEEEASPCAPGMSVLKLDKLFHASGLEVRVVARDSGGWRLFRIVDLIAGMIRSPRTCRQREGPEAHRQGWSRMR